jgi:hypothetical protein
MKLRSGRTLDTANTVPCSELPQIAVDSILRRARGRIIAGINKYARVCRQWRDAGGDPESLQLLADMTHLPWQDLEEATKWLSIHGQHVDTLVIDDGRSGNTEPAEWCASAAPTLVRLRRLEVSEANSLEQLVPVLQHLPQLQHLAVSLDMSHRDYVYIHPKSAQPKEASPRPGAIGKLMVSAEHPEGWVPDMQELCPQLTSLHLTVAAYGPSMKMPSSVSQLFSPRLQQLTLADWFGGHYEPVVYAASLAHLSALQQLTLDGVVLGMEGPQAGGQADGAAAGAQGLEALQNLAALQQLRVYHPHRKLVADAALVPLASKLVDYEESVTDQDPGALTSYLHLTRLVLTGQVPVGTAEALAALTGLQELGLHGLVTTSTAGVVQQVAGMAQLCSLQLVGSGMSPVVVGPCLAQCTQLTSLVLLVEGPGDPDAASDLASTLQQLTGLRSLAVHEQLVGCEQGGWLEPLTQLTSLCVTLRKVPALAGPARYTCEDTRKYTMQHIHATAQRLMEQMQLQAWPMQLQQVTFLASPKISMYRCGPMCWQQAAPGGAQVTVWVERQSVVAPGWTRPLRPCPHLPGVWEVQLPVQNRPWHLVGLQPS